MEQACVPGTTGVMAAMAVMTGMWEEKSKVQGLPGGSELVSVAAHKCRAPLQYFSTSARVQLHQLYHKI